MIQKCYVTKAFGTESDSTMFLLGKGIKQGNKGTVSGSFHKHKHNKSALHSYASEFAFKRLWGHGRWEFMNGL
jgi:hypothetical protein